MPEPQMANNVSILCIGSPTQRVVIPLLHLMEQEHVI